VHWGIDVMMAIDTPNHPDKELLEKYCGWIRQYRELIKRLKQINFISQNTRQYIREHGLCVITGDLVEKMLEEKMRFLEYNPEACDYAGKLIDFFNEQSKIIPAGDVWIGSSEILESLFGKLKCLEHDQSKGGFTSLVLGAAACVGKIDADVVKNALEQIKTADVDAWTNEQMGSTLISKRRKALGSWRKKKRPKKVEHESTGISTVEAMGF